MWLMTGRQTVKQIYNLDGVLELKIWKYDSSSGTRKMDGSEATILRVLINLVGLVSIIQEGIVPPPSLYHVLLYPI